MRISDWSSDVCSSDLNVSRDGDRQRDGIIESGEREILPDQSVGGQCDPDREGHAFEVGTEKHEIRRLPPDVRRAPRRDGDMRRDQRGRVVEAVPDHQRLAPSRGERREARSEEHTSELQSLMRSTYAAFCLKKKNI